jgi:hypothetical protein
MKSVVRFAILSLPSEDDGGMRRPHHVGDQIGSQSKTQPTAVPPR